MRNKVIIILAIIGIVVGLVSAYVYNIPKKPLPPAFKPASNPYARGIYANGIIESYQGSGENINISPEVSGEVTYILVAEGQAVRRGTPLLTIDDSVQRALVGQQKSSAEAARAVLEQLKAQPRRENLDVAKAQVDQACASLKSARDQYDKLRRSCELDPRSVSKSDLDNAQNAVGVAAANLEVFQRQYALTKAGAWKYDIRNQEQTHNALSNAYSSSAALLAKYIVRAPVDGVVISMNASQGDYVSPLGAYNTYTQGASPVAVMARMETYLAVRCFVDEILLHRLPQGGQMRARMYLRGTNISVPLEYVRVQPYVTPKIELSNQKTERVDVRVLPVIFRFRKATTLPAYPGQLVDVYIAE